MGCHSPRAVTIESSLTSRCGGSHKSAQDGWKGNCVKFGTPFHTTCFSINLLTCISDETFSFMDDVFGGLVHWGAEYIVGASYSITKNLLS